MCIYMCVNLTQTTAYFVEQTQPLPEIMPQGVMTLEEFMLSLISPHGFPRILHTRITH